MCAIVNNSVLEGGRLDGDYSARTDDDYPWDALRRILPNVCFRRHRDDAGAGQPTSPTCAARIALEDNLSECHCRTRMGSRSLGCIHHLSLVSGRRPGWSRPYSLSQTPSDFKPHHRGMAHFRDGVEGACRLDRSHGDDYGRLRHAETPRSVETV